MRPIVLRSLLIEATHRCTWVYLWCTRHLATISRLLKIVGLFCRISSLLQGSVFQKMCMLSCIGIAWRKVCSELQGGVLQCAAARCSVFRMASARRCVAVCCNVLQWIKCSEMQEQGSVLQCVAVCCSAFLWIKCSEMHEHGSVLPCVAVCCCW